MGASLTRHVCRGISPSGGTGRTGNGLRRLSAPTKRKPRPVPFYALAFLCLLAGCRPSGHAEDKGARRPVLTVSIEPLRYVTERIAGDGFRVETFVPKGGNPETYEPSPGQMTKLGESLAFFMVGDLGFERAWTGRLRQMFPEVPFVRTSEGVRLTGGSPHGTPGNTEEGADPHVWTSPSRMKVIARNVCASLCKLDTAHARQFRENLRRELADLQATEDSIRTLTDSLRTRAFLIYHPTLTYFAQDFGLTQIAMEADGKEPSPSQLARIVRLCGEKQVRIVFVQREFDRRNAELIAGETGTRIVDINPLSYDWKGEMLKIARTLHEQ